jgi:long-chain acyl-CoA synthetase
VYTSGTTGRPKGCVLTHANLVAELDSVLAAEGVAERVLAEDTTLLLFLPLAHIFARVVLLAAVRAGARVALTHDLTHLSRELAELRPDLIVVVPRVLEKLYNTAERKAIAAGHPRLFKAAAETAIACSRATAVPGNEHRDTGDLAAAGPLPRGRDRRRPCEPARPGAGPTAPTRTAA